MELRPSSLHHRHGSNQHRRKQPAAMEHRRVSWSSQPAIAVDAVLLCFRRGRAAAAELGIDDRRLPSPATLEAKMELRPSSLHHRHGSNQHRRKQPAAMEHRRVSWSSQPAIAVDAVLLCFRRGRAAAAELGIDDRRLPSPATVRQRSAAS
nr:hypothetical protein Iba_chr11bCG11090 [Ipomoea batatas]GME15827.1 hypothetical protein Iba_scaffold16768CG0160 [Ipomoea batatas]